MKLTRFIKNEWLQLLILIMPFVIIAFVWDQIPERVPIHWDFNGHADRFGNKGLGLFLLPIINIGLVLLIGALSKIDPKALKGSALPSALKPIRLIISGFMFAVFCITVLILLGANVNIGVAFQLGLPILFLLLGYYLPTVQPNYFIGVRTPWTLESPENWRLTHRFAGRLWTIVSLLYIILAIALAGHTPEALFVTYLVMIIIPPLVYSWMIFQRSKKQGP